MRRPRPAPGASGTPPRSASAAPPHRARDRQVARPRPRRARREAPRRGRPGAAIWADRRDRPRRGRQTVADRSQDGFDSVELVFYNSPGALSPPSALARRALASEPPCRPRRRTRGARALVPGFHPRVSKGDHLMAAHPIVHIEIPAADTQKLGEFYKQAFGWTLNLDATFNYLQFSGDGGPAGAFVENHGEMSAAPARTARSFIWARTTSTATWRRSRRPAARRWPPGWRSRHRLDRAVQRYQRQSPRPLPAPARAGLIPARPPPRSRRGGGRANGCVHAAASRRRSRFPAARRGLAQPRVSTSVLMACPPDAYRGPAVAAGQTDARAGARGSGVATRRAA